MQRRWLLLTLIFVLVLLAAGREMSRQEGAAAPARVAETQTASAPTPPPTAQDAAAAAFTSLDGSQTFTVPGPGDPEYADYQEMLKQPRFQSVLQHSPGYALPYDPEWRAVIRGRRESLPVNVPISAGKRSLQELGEALLSALHDKNAGQLTDLRVNHEEWSLLCWPEFPQSRPYLKIPEDEAWGFHYARSMAGMRDALREYGGEDLQLVKVSYQAVKPYTNFTLYEGVTLKVFDRATRERHVLEFCPSILERQGQFKAFIYHD